MHLYSVNLSDESRSDLKQMNYKGADVLIVIGDGLSSKAVHKQAVPLIREFLPYMHELGMSVGPVVLAKECRVALLLQITMIAAW